MNTLQVKIALASCNQTARDWPNNLSNIQAAIDTAVDDQADLLCFEELCLSGYDCGDDFAYIDNNFVQQLLQSIADYAMAKDSNLIISIGHPWRFSDPDLLPGLERAKNPILNRHAKPFIVQSFLGQGAIIAMSAKRYLYTYDRGYEARYFTEWQDKAAADYPDGRDGSIFIRLPALEIEHQGLSRQVPAKIIPFGSPVLQIGQDQEVLNLSHLICEEYWIGSRFDGYPDNQAYGRDNPLAEKACDFEISIAVCPNASPPAANKIEKHYELCKLASAQAGVFVFTDGLGSSGASFAQFGIRLMAQQGEIIAEGQRLSFKPMAYTSQIVTLPKLSACKSKPHAELKHQFRRLHRPAVQDGPAAWELGALREFEEELRAELLWLFDYMRKNKIAGFTQALSGGADSAYNAAKIRLMFELSLQELGLEALVKALSFSSEALLRFRSLAEDPVACVDAMMQETLSCVYLKTNNNSAATLEAARSFVEGGLREDGSAFKGIGGRFYSFNIQPLVDVLALTFTGIDLQSLSGEVLADLLASMQGFLGLRPDQFTAEELLEKTRLFEQQLLGASSGGAARVGPILSTAHKEQSLTIENMQARIRQVLTLMMANFENRVGIANPNLDEICNAYTTFGGDMHSGQINLNAHKPKYRQLEQMQLLYSQGLMGLNPVAAFHYILQNRPSAELQPKDATGAVQQFDEQALGRSFLQSHLISKFMLYEFQQAGQKNSPIAVFERCQREAAFAEQSLERLHDMILQSYQNWGFAQHKIHAAPLAFTYGLNVDKQCSLRTPNISSNHRPELAQLTLYVLHKLSMRDGEPKQSIFSVRSLTEWMQIAALDAEFAAGLMEKMLAETGPRRQISQLYSYLREKSLDSLPKSKQTALFFKIGAEAQRC